ncbi:Molybdate-binding periplasmic protein precursor [Rubinisphaera italica]|uniref:Molybdate-binding periplasmic protein n=2 Tax=Rubinisphaera italica TaxID=2527969 RepID=A0A5C5XIE4_9PLAN|nr:Molybdate-binding periplasmic protein precursor [Rubinisphaera italica]
MFLVFIAGCADSHVEQTSGHETIVLKVAAAANLQYAMTEIESKFEESQPAISLEITYGSSGQFFSQLSQLAPYDIFFSADTNYPQKLVEQNLIAEADYFPYASGQIVLWVPEGSPLDLEASGLQILLDPSVKKIAIANPRLAPYGSAAVEAMQHFELYDQIKDKLVLGENISQTTHFVESKAADVGVLAFSQVCVPEQKNRGQYWKIPTDAYSPIIQAGGILKTTSHPEAARQFREFVLGSNGQKILFRFGYSIPEAN